MFNVSNGIIDTANKTDEGYTRKTLQHAPKHNRFLKHRIGSMRSASGELRIIAGKRDQEKREN